MMIWKRFSSEPLAIVIYVMSSSDREDVHRNTQNFIAVHSILIYIVLMATVINPLIYDLRFSNLDPKCKQAKRQPLSHSTVQQISPKLYLTCTTYGM